MSGDCAGQSRSWTLCSFIQVLLALAVWHRALSRWKIQCWARRRLKRAWGDGNMSCSKIWQFIVPSQTVSCPTPPALMHPQTIMLPPLSFTVATVEVGTYSSPRPLRTFGGFKNSWKLNSSDDRIFAQFACVNDFFLAIHELKPWFRSNPWALLVVHSYIVLMKTSTYTISSYFVLFPCPWHGWSCCGRIREHIPFATRHDRICHVLVWNITEWQDMSEYSYFKSSAALCYIITI